MRNQIALKAFKYSIYAVLMILLYVLQTTPALFSIAGVKPFLVIPFAIAIAMFEGEFVGALFGAFAGILCDKSASHFFGLDSILLFLCGFAAGMLIIYLLRCRLSTCLLLVGATALLRGLLDFFFTYAIWGYTGSWRILVFRTLPQVVYTVIFVFPFYWVVQKLYFAFERKLKDA